MTARQIYRAIVAVALVGSAALLAVNAPNALGRLGLSGVGVLVAALGIAVVLGALRAPSAVFERSPHPQPKAERVALLLPLLVYIFAVDGWWAAAVVNVVAQATRPSTGRRLSWFDRFGNTGIRVPVWFGLGFLHGPIAESGAAAFILLNGAWYTAANLFLLDPLLALRQGRKLTTLWRVHVRDLGSWLQLFGELAWGYLALLVAQSGGALLGLGALAPLIVVGVLQLELARTRARLHRLAISRDAVEAMLEANDPLPHLRSLLYSTDARLMRESLEVHALDPDGRWQRLARVGAVAPTTLRDRGASALAAIELVDDGVGESRDESGTAYAYPVRADRRLVGALVVYRLPRATAALPTAELERAAAELGPVLGDFATIAATRNAASFDVLTGLANRRAVTVACEAAMAHVRDGGRYAMLLLDLDHFKSVNDLLGHQEGDRVLARIGRIIAENVREGDVAGRFGGEEFIVLLREAGRERALAIAERLRTTIESSGLAYADGKPLTISVGVAYASAADLPADVIARADRALYRAKDLGRNRVVESATA